MAPLPEEWKACEDDAGEVRRGKGILQCYRPETEAHLMPAPSGSNHSIVCRLQVFYFNFGTGESMWDHPSDALFKQLVVDERTALKRKPKHQVGHSPSPMERANS